MSDDSAITGETFKGFITTFVMFIIFASILYVCYQLVATSVIGSLTGDARYDVLLNVVLIAFPAGVIMILYKKYVGDDDE